MPKVCEYVYINGMYQTDCKLHLINRPQKRCDKCGRKPAEKVIAFHREKLIYQEASE
jgi:hypothetical protein